MRPFFELPYLGASFQPEPVTQTTALSRRPLPDAIAAPRPAQLGHGSGSEWTAIELRTTKVIKTCGQPA